MQVCVPSTPAQIYHLLRRQMLRPYRRPLIVMSPKSLLRHKEAVVDAGRARRRTIPERDRRTSRSSMPKNVKRVIACSGKVYYELLAYRREHAIEDVAIIRVEQPYPFPHEDFTAALAQFPKASEVVWCQEEPQNQGAWYRLREYLRADALPEPDRRVCGAARVARRPPSATCRSTSMQQQQLIEDAFAPTLAMGAMHVGT